MNRKWIEIALCLAVAAVVCAVLVGVTYSQIRKAKVELAELQTKILESEAYEADLKNKIADLNTERTTLDGEKARVNNDLEAAKAELERITALNKAKENIISELNLQVSQLQASYDESRKLLDDTRKERDDIQERLNRCKDDYRIYQKKVVDRIWYPPESAKDFGLSGPDAF